jgi:hypothetical protein
LESSAVPERTQMAARFFRSNSDFFTRKKRRQVRVNKEH